MATEDELRAQLAELQSEMEEFTHSSQEYELELEAEIEKLELENAELKKPKKAAEGGAESVTADAGVVERAEKAETKLAALQKECDLQAQTLQDNEEDIASLQKQVDELLKWVE